MTLRCRLLGHELVPTKFVPDGGVIQRTLLAQCHRCGFTVKFETEEMDREGTNEVIAGP